MRLLSLWLPLLGSAAVQAVSLPSSDLHKRSETFRLGQVENADYKGSDAPTEMLKVHAKYGGTLSPALEEAIPSEYSITEACVDRQELWFPSGI